jgi:hypothetical protein
MIATSKGLDIIGRKLFHPTKNLWIRASQISPDCEELKCFCTLDVGLTDRAFQDIGDISKLTPLYSIGSEVLKEETVLDIEWDGHLITSADELYHTVWQTISDNTRIKSPFEGKIEWYNNLNPIRDHVHDDTVLFSLRACVHSVLATVADEMIEEETYKNLAKSNPYDGKFGTN